MPRGGRRQGTQGKAYSNRTDLGVDYAPGGNPASGGIDAPKEQELLLPTVRANQVPNIGDPTAFPSEPVTNGLAVGPGAGPEALPPLPPSPTDPVRQVIQAMLLTTENPDLLAVLRRLDYEERM